jgi:hypothetical protein
LKNYILRIYRQKRNNPRSIVGIVEEPERKEKKAFTSFSELWEILNSGSKRSIAETQKKRSIKNGL